MKNSNDTVPGADTADIPAAPEKKRSWLKIVILLCLLFAVLIFSGAAGLAAAAFSPKKHIPLEPLKNEDLILQQKLVKRLSREVLRRRPKKESTLVLKTTELRSLLRLIDFGLAAAKIAGKYDGMELRYFEPEFSANRIRAIYPLDTGHTWLFGGVLRWQLSVTPDFSDKRVNLDIHDCRLGVIPLPKTMVEEFLLKILDRLYRSKDYEQFCSMVRKIYMKTDGSLVVIYRPAKLLPLLMF